VKDGRNPLSPHTKSGIQVDWRLRADINLPVALHHSNLDLNVVIDDLNLVGHDTFLGRRAAVVAGSQIESRRVPGALNFGAQAVTFVQWGLPMGAEFIDCKAFPVGQEKGEFFAAHLDTNTLTRCQVGKPSYRHERHRHSSRPKMY
jgi:hypothetical protein